MSLDPHELPPHPDGTPREASKPSGGRADSGADPQEERQKLLRDYGRYSSVGIQFGVSLVLFALGGFWLDQKLGTSPLLLALGVLAGFGGGLYLLLVRFPVSKRRSKKPPKTP